MHLVGRRSAQYRTSGELDVAPLDSSLDAVPEAADDTVRLGHLSDPHYGKPLGDGEVPAILGEWLEAFADAGVDVVVLSGDLVETPGDRVGMLRIRRLLEDADLPWVVVPGNHDIVRPSQHGPFGDLFGAYPRIERHAGVEFVLLDSLAEPTVDERTPFERLDLQQTGSLSTGRVGDRQLRRATGLLSDSNVMPRVLVVHHHLRSADDVPGDTPTADAPPVLMVPCLDAKQVTRWAAHHDVRLAFHGHQHAHWPPYVVEDQTVVLNSGSSTRGKPTRRARIVDVDPADGPTTIWEVAYG
jgi:3',5'-cyclic AMP phosphodiesterase CpdA